MLRTTLLLPCLLFSSTAYFNAILSRALLLIPPRSRDKLALTHSDFVPAGTSTLNAIYTTQLQVTPFTCKFDPNALQHDTVGLFNSWRFVFGHFLNHASSESAPPIPISLASLLTLTIATADPFNVGFAADSAGRKSFVEYQSEISTLRDFFTSKIQTQEILLSIDSETLFLLWASELTKKSGAAGDIEEIYGKGIYRWLDESSKDLCAIYKRYRVEGSELKASLVVGEQELGELREIGKVIGMRAVVRVAVLLHLIANRPDSVGLKNLWVFVGVGVIGVAGIILVKKFVNNKVKY
jgi:hypothetical protein